ncbi:MAG: elongation factor G, partial [Balneolaceae bacterium]
EGLQKTILNRQIFPMFCMSALRNMGAGRLMGFIGNVLPPPPAAHPVPLTGGGNLKIENNDKPVLFSFKTYAEPHVGNLNYLKVINGPVAQGMDLENRRNQHSQRLSTLSVSQGGKRADITAAEAGDLIVAVKLTDIQTTDTLTEKGRDITVEPGFYPGPTVRKAVELLREGEEDKLGPALHQLLQEDPTLHMEQSPELNQTVLHGLGEEHLTVVHEQLSRRFGLDIRYVKPRIPYRETITRTVRTHYKHKKQSGGAGQYAEVYMILEPWQEGMADSEELSVRDVQEIDLPWGGKLIFRNCIVGGIIDNRFMPAILKGVMEKMEKGPVSGCRARDIRVSVYDGSMHSVDSNDAAFRTAALMAFREGFMKAYPQLMEPVYEVEITVPEMYMGDVMSDLSSRRGQIQGIDSDGPVQKIMANVPLQELDQYSTRLKSMTRGSAFHTLRFSHYNTLPREIQQQVISKHMASEPA